MLDVRLFGPPTILSDGQPIHINRRKSRALAYFIAAAERPVTREKLLAVLWPDLDRKDAQQNLRVALHGLRKALGDALRVDDDTVWLDARVDARTVSAGLETRAGGAGLATVLDAYAGDFLDEFELPEAPDFESWLVVERTRYRRLVTRGLGQLAAQHERAGRYHAALDALDRALQLDPLQEDFQRDAMRLHVLAGDRAAAIRRYDALRKLLDDELGVPPMTETRALYDAIIRDEPIAGIGPTTQPEPHRPRATDLSPASSDALPFTGRAIEMEVLRAAFERVPRALALVEGEAGIGKSRFIAEHLAVEGGLALVGAAREQERALPYRVVVEALRGVTQRADWPSVRAALNLPDVWLSEVARLLPELAESSPPAPNPDEPRLWEGVHQFLRALAAFGPLTFVLDDAQWADESSLALLGYLARQPHTSIRCIVATRSVSPRTPLAALVQALTRESRLVRIALQRLSADDVAGIARQLTPVYFYPFAEWLAKASEGNPYVLAELIQHAREVGILSADGTVNLSALSSEPVVPQSIYALVQSRLQRLSDEARRMADVGVAIGREFEFDIAQRASGLSESAALDALDELRASRIVNQVGASTSYAFDHSLTMEVAYREVGEARHRLLHRRVAEAIEAAHAGDLDQHAGLIAYHFSEGLAPERAAPFALRAGQRAAKLAAWQEAAAFFERALIGETNPARRFDAFMLLGDARAQLGAQAGAGVAFARALDIAQTLKSRDKTEAAQLRLGQSYIGQARYAEGIGVAEILSRSDNAEMRIEGEALWGALLTVEGSDLDEATRHAERAVAQLDLTRPDHRRRLGQIKFDSGGIAAQQGDLQRAVALYREALAVAEQTEDDSAIIARALAYNNLAYHLSLLGDPSAKSFAEQGLKLAQDSGALGWQAYLLSTLGEIAMGEGDLDTAERRFSDGLALAERVGVKERVAGLNANLGLVARAREDEARAIFRLSTALAQADALGNLHLAAQIRIWLAPLLPPAEARQRLAEARAIAESGGRKRLLEEIAIASYNLR